MLIRKSFLFLSVLATLLFASTVFAQPCACTTGCTMVIDSAYNGNLNLLAYDKVCITSKGFVKGNIYLAWNSQICNAGKIYGEITVEGKDCNGCGDEHRLCNTGEIYFTKVTPGIHTRFSNYGVMKICGDVPGPKSFTIDNYPGACLDIKGTYKIAAGVSANSIWDGSVTIGGDMELGGNVKLDVYGSAVVKGTFKLPTSCFLNIKGGACMDINKIDLASAGVVTVEDKATLRANTIAMTAAGSLVGPTSGYGQVIVSGAITQCCGVSIKNNLDVCIQGSSANKVTTGIGPNVTWCAKPTYNCPTHVTCAWTCCLAINATGVLADATCGNNDGSITVSNPTGGTAPYTYQWNDGVTTKNRTGLAAGTYWLTIIDKDSCQFEYPVNIHQKPCGPTVTATGAIICPNVGACGNITATPGGVGTPPYTYAWSNGKVGAGPHSICPTATTTYTVTLTDKNNLTATATTTITVRPTFTVTTAVTKNPTCAGKKNGSANVRSVGTGIGGTETFLWGPSGGAGVNDYGQSSSGGPVVNTASGLGAGTYTVTVTNAFGCTQTGTVTLVDPAGMTLTPASTTANCGSSNGTASVVATPANKAPFTYIWSSGGATGATATGLAAGTYTVTVTDKNGCTESTSAVVNSVGGATVTIPSQSNVSCKGGNDGSATISITGGATPYTIVWTPASVGTGTTISSLVAGTYSVVVKDANGCQQNSSLTITEPPLLTANVTGVSPQCSGFASVSVVAGGGTVAYAYNWMPGGATSQTVSGLATGIYSVTVTDSKNCTAVSTTSVTVPAPIIATTTPVHGTCGSTGSASVSTTGGTLPYKYVWSPSGGTAPTASPLSAGSYTVVITDANGCTSSSTTLITATPAVTVTIPTHTNTTCASPGSAVASPAGGTGPFTYNWSPTGGTAITGTPLGAGTYTVALTDANGCTSSSTVVITSPPMPILLMSKIDATCNKSNGSASVSASGGLTPYTYAWSNGPTSVTASAIPAGTYTVVVTDANGCSTASSIVVNNLNGPQVTPESTNVTCFGANNGTGKITVSGGVLPYTYAWSSGGTGSSTTSSINGLVPGTYTVSLTDGAACLITSTITITEPPQINITGVITPANCNTANGTIVVTATGGVGVLTPVWSSGGASGFTATNLAAGSYTVTITDATSCTASSAILVGNVGAPTIVVNQTNILCKGGNNGAVTINISGGTPGYTIAWTPTPLGTGTTVSSLVAGTYTVVVTDANTCQENTVVTITEPSQLTATANGQSPLCPGSGSVSVTAGGGTTNYTYNWLPGGATSQTVSGLATGIYSVTVTDANACSLVSTASITVPDPIILLATPVDGNCGLSNGSANVNAAGGTPTYTYNWTPVGGTTSSATGLAADTYTVLITDANGCTETTTAIVGNSPPVTIDAVSTNVSCFGGNDGTVTATSGGGTSPFDYIWSPSGGTSNVASSLIAGVYVVSVVDAKGCTATSTATVTEPTQVSLAVPAVGDICIGQSTTLTAIGAGGTPTYTHLWMPGSFTGSSIVVNPTTTTAYTVSMVDSKGCTATSSVTVKVGPPLQVSTGAGQNVCAGASTSVSATGSGGSGNYTYSWEPGTFIGSTFNVTPTGSVTYTVTLTDDCGTPAVTDVVTVQPVNPLLTPQFTPDSTSGCSPLCVTFGNTTTGGVTQGCKWDFGDGNSSTSCNPTHCYRVDGFYNVSLTVTDTNGCASSLTKLKSIKVHPVPTANFTANPKSVSILEPLITFTDKSSSNVVKWDWNFGDTYNSSSTKKNPTFTYKDTGKYTIQLISTTLYGCKDTAVEYIYINGDFRFYVPNAFTPNGDGKNDTFFPKGFMINEQKCYKMMIFDRWGNLIFETSDLETGWDGRANGGVDVAQQDVYVWKILVCDFFNKKYSYIGHVTLVK